MTLKKKALENTVRKGENAGKSHGVFYCVKERTHHSINIEFVLYVVAYFYAPASQDRGHIVLPLCVCLSAQT